MGFPSKRVLPPKTMIMVIIIIIIMLSSFIPSSMAQDSEDCARSNGGECYNRPKALKLKIIAIAVILIASMIGICLPLFSTSVPALSPERNLFFVVKAFASGVILSTGFMHVLPDSFAMLQSPCLPHNPWHAFPFSAFVSMLSAIFTLMLDSFSMAFYSSRGREKVEAMEGSSSVEMAAHAHDHGHGHGHGQGHGHGHGHGASLMLEAKEGEDEKTLLRNRVIAQVLELGIVVHSVVIGLSMGASQNPCTIRPLVAALCFHQFFEGMGLGGCILQAQYGFRMKAIMAFFFATTTPFGIALGIGLSNVYSDNSPTALIVIGLLNASSSGLLIYMALVDLLAADFMGKKLQSSMKLQGIGYVAVLLGIGGMSLMAKWA